MYSQARALIWAQWRSLLNFYPYAGKGTLALTALVSLVWYGGMAGIGVFAVLFLSNPSNNSLLPRVLPGGLLLAFLYWQSIPLLLASSGASLDLKKIRIYPIPESQLFTLEVLLRFSTGLEVVLVLSGAALGLALNPALPLWAPLGLVPFVAFNLYLSVGIRDLLGRLLARRRLRELLVVGIVLLASLPQLLVVTGLPEPVRHALAGLSSIPWPWTAATALAMGEASGWMLAAALAWTAAAWRFGRWQFSQSQRFDEQAAQASVEKRTRGGAWMERFYRWPSAVFPDPLGALIEKEVRFLSRSPRFRLVFLMGFTFGLLIWLPLAYGRPAETGSVLRSHYLSFVSVYALMLLGEHAFWNTFGFDRTAAQIYFLLPVKAAVVLAAKNLAAVFFVLLEISLVGLVCKLFGLPVTGQKLAEAYAVTLVMAIYMLAVGNLSSTYHPRAVDPGQSWRNTGSRWQLLLLLVYPLLGLPIALAYLARFAFETDLAFYGVLAFAAAVGAVVYWVAMESAVEATESRREDMLAALARGRGPVTA